MSALREHNLLKNASPSLGVGNDKGMDYRFSVGIIAGMVLGTILHNRYRLESEIGHGGMGVVYRAHDLLLNRAVAIKLLSASHIDGISSKQFLAEARAAARLNHPNIVGVHDAGEIDGQPFIVMEFIEGESLRHRPPQSLTEALEMARQICTALEHAHLSGIIHRDLKPENIMATPHKTVKLTDFGLAQMVDAPPMTEEGVIAGTFLYLAPEILLGQPATPQSDLYAFGLILYELMAGRHPFTGNNIMAIISQHLNAPIVPPSTYNAKIPSALDLLVLHLLHKKPDHRPASAKEVRQTLELFHLDQSQLEKESAGKEEFSLLHRLVRGRMVGREREFREVKAIWSRSLAGEGHLVLVSGEPGVGKTRLVRELYALAEVSKWVSLFGECYVEGNIPYSPIAQIVEQALLAITLAPGSLPLNLLADLTTLAPTLHNQLPDLPANPPLDPLAEQQRLFDSVATFFNVVSSRSPVLIVLDDVHWADSGTLLLLRHLARRARKMSLLIVLTYREVELGDSSTLNEVLIDLNRERLATRIKLGRLSWGQTQEMLGVMFGSAGQDLTKEFVDLLYRETEGNPFFLEEVCKALVEEGKIYREGGRWLRSSVDQIQVPQSVKLAIQARVTKMPAQTQDILRLAAIIGREFEFNLLQKAIGLDENSLIEALETAERAQLIHGIQSNSPRSIPFTFVHALIPSTLRDSLSILRRQRLHRQVAIALETLHPDDWEMLAYHYSQAGDEARALGYYVQAGQRAKGLFAHQDALHFYGEALALMAEEDVLRFDLLRERAGIYEMLGNREARKTDVQQMLTLAQKQANPTHLIDALITQADLLLETEPSQAHQPIEQAIELSRQIHDLEREAHALHRLGRFARHNLDPIHSQQALETAVAYFRKLNQPREAAIALNQLSLTLQSSGDLAQAQQAIEEALQLSRLAQDKRQESVNLRRLAAVYGEQRRHIQAQQTIEQALFLTRKLGDRFNESHTLNILGLVLVRQKKLAEAEESYQQSIEIAEMTGSNAGIWPPVFNLVWGCYYPQGKLEAGLQFFDQYIAKAQQLNDNFLQQRLEATKASLLAQMGQYAQALAIKEHWLSSPHHPSSQSALTADLAFIGKLQAECGLFHQAHQNLDRSLQQAEQSGRVLEQIDALVQLIFLAWREFGTDGLQNTIPLGQRLKELVTDTLFDDWIVTCYSLIAQQHLALEQFDQAHQASSYALQVAKEMLPLAHDLFCLITYYQTSVAIGNPEEGKPYLQIAYQRIDQVAQQTLSPKLRQSWLEKVLINRQVITIWQKIQQTNS